MALLGQPGLTLDDPTARHDGGGGAPTALLFWFARLSAAALALAVLAAYRPWVRSAADRLHRALTTVVVVVAVGGAVALVLAVARGGPVAWVVGAVVGALVYLAVSARADRLVERLLHGRRPTPYRVLLEITELTRTAAPGTELDRLPEAIGRHLGARTVQLTAHRPGLRDRVFRWRREDAGEADASVVFPIRHREDEVGVLAVDGEAVAGGSERRQLLADVADSLGAVLQAHRVEIELERQLRAAVAHGEQIAISRRAAVAEMDGERRALERNLHDGAQHHLVSLRLALGLAEHQVGAGQLDAARDRLGQHRRAGRHRRGGARRDRHRRLVGDPGRARGGRDAAVRDRRCGLHGHRRRRGRPARAPLRHRRRGGRLLLLPRGGEQRPQARAGCRGHDHASRRSTASCASRCATTARASRSTRPPPATSGACATSPRASPRSAAPSRSTPPRGGGRRWPARSRWRTRPRARPRTPTPPPARSPCPCRSPATSRSALTLPTPAPTPHRRAASSSIAVRDLLDGLEVPPPAAPRMREIVAELHAPPAPDAPRLPAPLRARRALDGLEALARTGHRGPGLVVAGALRRRARPAGGRPRARRGRARRRAAPRHGGAARAASRPPRNGSRAAPGRPPPPVSGSRTTRDPRTCAAPRRSRSPRGRPAPGTPRRPARCARPRSSSPGCARPCSPTPPRRAPGTNPCSASPPRSR